MSKGQIILAVIIECGFVLITALYFLAPDSIPEAVDKNFGVIITAWIVNFTTVINYQFGSSKGSADKTSIIAKPNGQ